MTAVRQKREPVPDAPRKARGHNPPTASSVVQVRLQVDEMTELGDAMRVLALSSRSEALREGIRLLLKEAREIEAADEIRRFYAGKQAPLPEGVAPTTAAELAAADREQW